MLTQVLNRCFNDKGTVFLGMTAAYATMWLQGLHPKWRKFIQFKHMTTSLWSYSTQDLSSFTSATDSPADHTD